MRIVIAASILMAILPISAAAQDHSVPFQQSIQNTDNWFTSVWRPKIADEKDISDRAARLARSVESAAEHAHISSDGCAPDELGIDGQEAQRTLSQVRVQYEQATESERANHNSLGRTYAAENDMTARIQDFVQYSVSYLKLRMYLLVSVAIVEDEATAEQLNYVECVGSRPPLRETVPGTGNAARDGYRMLGVRVEDYRATAEWIANFHT
jgi:hypothetical protein